jgi:hypothetical protein
VFGEVAELYDAVRPGYLDAAVEEVLRYADLGAALAVEVGAGTGKATVPFAARGVPVVCVEPDPKMAQVLRRNVAAYPGVAVEVERFEDWHPAGRSFGLLYAAASWHWVERDRRWSLAHAALVPGGAVAVLGNVHRVLDRSLLAALAAIDDRYGFGGTGHAVDLAYEPADAGEPVWPAGEAERDQRFTDVRNLEMHDEVRFPTARYLDYLRSISMYRLAGADRREQALAEVADLLERRGGIDLDVNNTVMLARTV